MKRNRIIAVIAIGLLLVASLVSAFFQPSPMEIARAHCSERGFQAENLALLGYRDSGTLFGKTGTVEFQVKGANPARKMVVELRQSMYFLPWQVVDFREEVQH